MSPESILTMWKWLSVTNQEVQHCLLKASAATTGIASEKKERSKAAIGKEKQKVATQSEMENGKWFIFLPSRLSRSCLHQAALPGQVLGHRPPGRSSISAHCRVPQTGCCRAVWHSVSKPAEVRTPPSPGKSCRETPLTTPGGSDTE